VTQTVGFFDAGLEFALNRQTYLNGKRVERLDEQLPMASSMAAPWMRWQTGSACLMPSRWQMYSGHRQPWRLW